VILGWSRQLVVAVVGACGPVAARGRAWAAAWPAIVVGWPWPCSGHALHRLAQRWLVFVPGGIASSILTLTDSVSMTRGAIAPMGPAPADTTAETSRPVARSGDR
jgi:hypothetical protein